MRFDGDWADERIIQTSYNPGKSRYMAKLRRRIDAASASGTGRLNR